MSSTWDNSNKFPKIDFMVVRYEVFFQDRVTDQYFTCKHAHESIEEAVACLYHDKRTVVVSQPHAILAVSGGYYRDPTPEEEYRVAKASRRFIV